jgi:hypothetical protein
MSRKRDAPDKVFEILRDCRHVATRELIQMGETAEQNLRFTPCRKDLKNYKLTRVRWHPLRDTALGVL